MAEFTGKKKIIGFINAENDVPSNVIRQADFYSCNGADGIFVYNYTGEEEKRQEFIKILRRINREIDIPFYTGMHIESFDDGAEALDTGAQCLVIRKVIMPDPLVVKKISDEYGSSRLAAEIDMMHDFHDARKLDSYIDMGFGSAVLKHIDTEPSFEKAVNGTEIPVFVRDSLQRHDITSVLSVSGVQGIITNYYDEKNITPVKSSLKESGINVQTLEPGISFKDFKKDQNGLVPAVVQDYLTGEVLMLAYMNEESFEKTIETGLMTYFSRSRQELWCKGETSGHFQYVKSLRIDCDEDTILANVRQVGAACHTGHRSCFYRDLARKDYIDSNVSHVLNESLNAFKELEKSGAGTEKSEESEEARLLMRGTDELLKILGEKSAAVTVSAKNGEKEKLVRDIASEIEGIMLLMAKTDVDWTDIVRSISRKE